jgi:hypothetical protein
MKLVGLTISFEAEQAAREIRALPASTCHWKTTS